MLIKQNEFDTQRYPNIEIISNTDNGLFAVQYDNPPKAAEVKLQSDSYNWRFRDEGDCYALIVPQPKQRKIIRTLMVRRTSKNYYEIAYADAQGCEFNNVKTLDAVHTFLFYLWRRSKENDGK